MKYITRTIWILSLVSLFTDTASEMLYPVMPIYLKTIGFSVILIGILEGLAEAVAGLSKGYFGKLSDSIGRRVPFVKAGYALSALSKPMLALFVYPIWIFFSRTLDRFGKGIRTGARDALLSDEAAQGTKGKVFGFHRSMDTLGAVAGPSFALLYLWIFPQNYRTLFLIAFIPGLLAIWATFLLKENDICAVKTKKRISFFSFIRYWKEGPVSYRKVTVGILVFTLFNSSDVFLLLKAKEAGLGDTAVIGVYIFYNLIYAIFSFPLGAVADKKGLKTVFVAGLLLFASVYTLMAVNTNYYIFFIIFFLYGIYAAATEGVSKAWISNLVNKKDTGTAIGTFTGFQSIFTMLASTLTGMIWFRLGSTWAISATAVATFIIALYFIIFVPAFKMINNHKLN
jgi:MFS family permease